VDIPAELDSPTWRSLISDVDIGSDTGTFRVGELFVKLPTAVVAN